MTKCWYSLSYNPYKQYTDGAAIRILNVTAFNVIIEHNIPFVYCSSSFMVFVEKKMLNPANHLYLYSTSTPNLCQCSFRNTPSMRAMQIVNFISSNGIFQPGLCRKEIIVERNQRARATCWLPINFLTPIRFTTACFVL